MKQHAPASADPHTRPRTSPHTAETAAGTAARKNSAYTAAVQRIAGQQGWTSETLGGLALSFLEDLDDLDGFPAGGTTVRSRFLTFLEDTQDSENAP